MHFHADMQTCRHAQTTGRWVKGIAALLRSFDMTSGVRREAAGIRDAGAHIVT